MVELPETPDVDRTKVVNVCFGAHLFHYVYVESSGLDDLEY